MRYIAEDATLRFRFTTRRFSSGATYTLAGSPSLAVYPEDSDTQITAGITLTADYDSITGLNNVVIDLSASASYTAGRKYEVTIAAGTVDSVSVVGEVLYEFYIHASGGVEALLTRALLALPAAAADAAGGLPISDAGGLDLDSKLAATNEVTAARMGALTDWINGGRLDLLLDAVKAVTDALPDAGALTTLLANVAAALADTNELQTDWANGGRLDLILDARASQTSVDDLPTNAELATALGTADDAVLAQIALVKAKTDSLTFTTAGQVDANIQYVNDVEVTGDGQTGTEWGPA